MLAKVGASISSIRQDRGMPLYDEFSDREIEQIFWYIRQRARESLEKASPGK